jgi:hypothetical protein
MSLKSSPFIFCAFLCLALISCKQDSPTSTMVKARTSYSPYGSGEEVPLRWNDSRLVSGLSLKIASEVAALLDYGGGLNGYTDAATEWNNALSDKTFYALPLPMVTNRQKPQLVSYYDDEMGIYKSQNWYSEVGAGALAITQFFGIRRTGANGQYIELQHADIILNFRDYSFSSNSENFFSYDLPSVLLHEMGHFIGLRHEYDSYDSIMRPSLGSYESERQLYPIDVHNLGVNYNTSGIQPLSVEQPHDSGIYAGAISSPMEGELVQGRFELRANGYCIHFLNGRQTVKHPANLLNLFNGIYYGLESI